MDANPCAIHFIRNCRLCEAPNSQAALSTTGTVAIGGTTTTTMASGYAAALVQDMDNPIPKIGSDLPKAVLSDPVATGVMRNAEAYAQAVEEAAKALALVSALEVQLERANRDLANAVSRRDAAQAGLYHAVSPKSASDIERLRPVQESPELLEVNSIPIKEE